MISTKSNGNNYVNKIKCLNWFIDINVHLLKKIFINLILSYHKNFSKENPQITIILFLFIIDSILFNIRQLKYWNVAFPYY